MPVNNQVRWMIGGLDSSHVREIAEQFERRDLSRYCFHGSDDSNLHVMLVCIPPDVIYPIHRHHDTDEWYIVMRGKLIISIFNADGTPKNSFTLKSYSEASQESQKVGILMEKGVWHETKSTGCGAIFLEIRSGPFDKGATEYLTTPDPND